MPTSSHPSGHHPGSERKVPLDPVELGKLTLDVSVKLVTGTAIDGTFGLSPMAGLEVAAAMVGAAFSEHVEVVANMAAADAGAAAKYINDVMADAMALFSSLQKATAEKQAVAMAKALGLNVA